MNTWLLTFVGGDVRECEYDEDREVFTHVLHTVMQWHKDDPRIARIRRPWGGFLLAIGRQDDV